MSTSMIPVETSPEELARLAAERPDLWDEIWAHPSAYPDLRQWIAERRAAVASANGAAVAGEGSGEGEGSLPKPRRGRRVVLASVLAGALVLGGGTAALAATGVLGSWFGGSPKPAAEAPAEPKAEEPSFANGLVERWSVEQPEQMVLADVLQIPGGLLVTLGPSAGDGAAAQLLDVEDGSVLWEGGATGAACTADPANDGAVCALAQMLGQGPTDVVLLDGDGERSSFTVDGFWTDPPVVDGESIVLSASGKQVRVDRSGSELPLGEVPPQADDSATASKTDVPVGDYRADFSADFARVSISDGDRVLVEHALDAPADATAAHGGAEGVVISSTCSDCDPPFDRSLFSLAFYGPASEKPPAEADPSGEALPAGMPGCPAPTQLLAWAEFTDGWVLVCGVDADRPGYLAVQLPGASKPLLSRGASKPDGKEAQSAVRWDEHLQRYTAELADGSSLVLEDDTGTVTVWEGEAQTGARTEEKWVIRIFLPWRDPEPRTLAAPSGREGTGAGASGSLALPNCAAMNPGLTEAAGVEPAKISAARAEIFGPVVRTALRSASAQSACEWSSGSGSAMQWVSVITPEQKNALIDGMLDFGYRAEVDGPLLRVSYTQSGEHHTHVFEGDAWIFIYQAGIEGYYSEPAIDAVRELNPERG